MADKKLDTKKADSKKAAKKAKSLTSLHVLLSTCPLVRVS